MTRFFGGRGGSSVGTSKWSDRVTAGSSTGIWYQVGTLVKTLPSTDEPRVAQQVGATGNIFR